MKLLGIKPFYGTSLYEVINYLRIDAAKAFGDLFAVIGSVKLAEAYVEDQNDTFTSFSASGAEEDVASITLGPGEWNVFGSVLFGNNGATGTLTGKAWISTASNSSGATVFGQSRVEVLISGSSNRQATVFARLKLGERSNVYLGASSVYTGGPVQRLGSIWAIGRK